MLHCNAAIDGIEKSPPKFAIANGFVIGSIPHQTKFINKEGEKVTGNSDDDELTDTLKAMIPPVRPYRYVFAYCGGAQKYLRGIYQVF